MRYLAVLILNNKVQGVPKKETLKTGEDITSKLGQPAQSNFRFLKANLIDIKCL